MKTRTYLVVVVLIISALLLSGCVNVVNIPAGYAAKILTPTGWARDWLEAGQVDLGTEKMDGTYNSLVLLEVTSTTVLEQFVGSGQLTDANVTDTEDHRVLTKDGVPISVDVYVRLMVPEDKDIRTDILAQVTPVYYEGDPNNVLRINVQDIYEQFAQPEIRGAIRALFAGYDDYAAVYADYSNIPTKLGTQITTILANNNVPLILMSVSLSNVKPDETIWAAMNQVVAAEAQADAIETVGEAMKDNPEYLQYMQWDYLLQIAKAGNNSTFIIDGSGTQSSSDYAAAQYILQQLEAGKIDPVPTSTP